MEAMFDENTVKVWPIQNYVVGRYQTFHSEDFSLDDEDVVFTLRLRCTAKNAITLVLGVDDIILNKIERPRTA